MDEHEQDVLGMLAELEAAGQVPESIKRLNDAVIASARDGSLFPEPVIARMILSTP